jgi:hypothetical protein
MVNSKNKENGIQDVQEGLKQAEVKPMAQAATPKNGVYPPNNLYAQTNENAVAGTIGAFIFALGGGVLWFLVYQVGFIAGIIGFVTMFLAMLGYRLFGKAQGIRAVVISIIITVIVIFVAEYICVAKNVYEAYQDWYKSGEIDYQVTFSDVMRNVFPSLTSEGLLMYGKDLLIGYGLAAIACFTYIKNAIRDAKSRKVTEEISL